MKNFILPFICGLLLVACNQTPQEFILSDSDTTEVMISNSVRDGIFIHITESYDNPHRLLMPLKMASIMANDKDVLVYMDIHAVEIMVQGAEDIQFEGFESAKTYIKELLDKDVGIYVCPTCLKVAGYQPKALIDGVQTAQKDKFFDFTRGRIISLDY